MILNTFLTPGHISAKVTHYSVCLTVCLCRSLWGFQTTLLPRNLPVCLPGSPQVRLSVPAWYMFLLLSCARGGLLLELELELAVAWRLKCLTGRDTAQSLMTLYNYTYPSPPREQPNAMEMVLGWRFCIILNHNSSVSTSMTGSMFLMLLLVYIDLPWTQTTN